MASYICHIVNRGKISQQRLDLPQVDRWSNLGRAYDWMKFEGCVPVVAEQCNR